MSGNMEQLFNIDLFSFYFTIVVISRGFEEINFFGFIVL